MSEDLLKLMRGIVNVRNYKNESISEDILTKLYTAFAAGPTTMSSQAGELLLISDKEKRNKLVEATLNPYLTKDSYGAQSWLLNAPFVCVVLVEKRRAVARVGEQGLSIAKQEVNASIQNFRLLAQSLGLSTACVREFDQDQLKENLDLPWYVMPVAILIAGYSDVKAEEPPRLSVSEIVSEEVWI